MIKLKKLLKEWNDTSFKDLPKRWSKPVMKGTEPDGLTEFERMGGSDVELGKVYTDKDRPPFQVKEETINENREIDKVYGDFEVLLRDFEKEFISLSAQAGRANDNKADEKILLKTLKKHIIPLYSMVRSWNRSSKRD